MFHTLRGGRHRLLILFTVCVGLAASGDNRLVDAVKDRNSSAVAALLRAHADVNVALPDGSTPLAWATYQDDTETAELLLQAGAKVTTVDQYGETPLTLACANGNAKLAEEFLKAGADANAARWDGETALMIASYTGNPQVVRMLVGHGAKPDAIEERKGQNALMWAATEGHSEAVAILLNAGANPNIASKGGFTPLIFATQKGDAKSVASLLASGADINHAIPAGMNALLIAVTSRKADVAEVLIANGAPVAAGDRTGNTLLHLAAQEGDAAIVRALLGKGADPNAKTNAVATASAAGGRGGRGVIGRGRGGAPSGEQTPIMLAAQGDHLDVMYLLVSGGANPKMKAQDGLTLMMAAARSGHPDVVQYAYELDPDVKSVTDSKQTVMHAAVTGTLTNSTPAEICKVIQFLADHGAELDPPDAAGRTPKAVAAPIKDAVALLTKLIAASGATPPPR